MGIKMNKLYAIVFLVLASSCATTYVQEHDEIVENVDVTLSNSSGPHFIVSMKPKKESIDNAQSSCYAEWLINEECKKRSYSYSDIGNRDLLNYVGFCYKENSKLGLNILFEVRRPDIKLTRLVVENLNNKVSTSLMVKDTILRMNGKDIWTMGDIKENMFQIADHKTKNVTLAILRDGKNIEVKEPIVEQTNNLLKVEDVNLFSCLRFQHAKQ
jgi:hypothetical protein